MDRGAAMIRVTTAVKGGPDELARATLIARRLDAELVPRRGSLDRLLEGDATVYVVGRERDELRYRDERLSLNEGLLRSRLHTGAAHPLIAAIAASGRAEHVIDGTAGLAGDSLHLSGALGCRVSAMEISPVLFSLLERGLPRLVGSRHAEVSDAASRVRPSLGDCVDQMAALPADSADAVLLAPMYPNPHKAAPGFPILRKMADHQPLTEAQVRAALRVSPRLVVKWPRGLARPDALSGGAQLREGHRVDYWIETRP